MHANAVVLVIKNVFLFNYSDELLNAMGSARLEIMDERDEEKENKTVTQQKVLPRTYGLKRNVKKCCLGNKSWFLLT